MIDVMWVYSISIFQCISKNIAKGRHVSHPHIANIAVDGITGTKWI